MVVQSIDRSVLYNSVAYALGLSLNVGYLLSLVLLTLSAYTVIGVVASIDAKAVKRRLSGVVPERMAGGVLAGLGAILALRVIGLLVQGFVGQTPIAEAERALHIADLVIAPALVIRGVLLWRREPLGCVVGTGLLFQASMLFTGLIALLLLQPLLTVAPFLPLAGTIETVWTQAFPLHCAPTHTGNQPFGESER